jgi:hypothetical protein
VAYLRILAVLMIALIISSCGSVLETDTTINLHSNERWEAEVQLVFAPQQLVLVSSQLEGELTKRIRKFQDSGIKASWRREENPSGKNIVYIITAKGQGFDKLNGAVFDGKPALQVDNSSGQNLIIFNHSPGLSSLGFVLRQTFTLSGGRLVSSNGHQVDNRTVTWTNPTGNMEAVFAESTETPWFLFGLIALGLFATLVVGNLFKSRKKPAIQTGSFSEMTPITPAPRFCSQCGSVLPNEAMFCPECGKQR